MSGAYVSFDALLASFFPHDPIAVAPGVAPKEFCRVFEPNWDKFETEFSQFVQKNIPATGAVKFSEALDQFFEFHPNFLLQGCIVDGSCFRNLLRVARDIDLKFVNPALFAARSLSLSKVAAFDDAQFERYFGDWPSFGITLSGRRGVVWAFDEDEVDSHLTHLKGVKHSFSPLAAQSLINLLGLVDLSQVKRVVLIGYSRNGPPPIDPKTPTIIDGLGHSAFLPMLCDKRGGRTRDLRGAGIGVREVVHARSAVVGPTWKWACL